MVAAIIDGLLAQSTEGDGSIWMLLLGPVGGVGVYMGLYQYYRNTDKSHDFERETRIEAGTVTGTDKKVDEIKGTRKTEIQGDNRSNHRQRVQRVQ